MSRADTKLRSYFTKSCYEEAEEDLNFLTGCNLLEQDLLDLMWNGLNFLKLLTANKENYTMEFGEVSNDTFEGIINGLANFSHEFFEILDEIDSHKEVTILRIKTYIDERTKTILGNGPGKPYDITEYKHNVSIQEELDGDEHKPISKLPSWKIDNSFDS